MRGPWSGFFSTRRRGGGGVDTLYPKGLQDIQDILRQAKDNATSIRVSGGSYPFTPLPGDVVVDLRYVDRLIGLDIYQQTVTVESGMKLSALSRILETVSLSLDLFGRVPDLTICDAVAIGAFGANANLISSLVNCEVALANGRIVTWNWDKAPNEMRALCCGLGMTAILLSVTFKCVPLQRYTEVSYLCSIRDVLDQWKIQMRSSFSQQLLWYPFSELTVMTHLNPTDKYHIARQPLFNHVLELVGDFCSRSVRRLTLLLSCVLGGGAAAVPPLLASIFARVQFFSQWSAAKHRSDFVHSLPRSWTPREACRGSCWLVPRSSLPEVICLVSQWTLVNPRSCASPLFVQTVVRPPPQQQHHHHHHHQGIVKEKRLLRKDPFLAPAVGEDQEGACAVWYDWFLPECDPDPIAVSEFEDIFHSVGGRRAWSGERLTSPLVLSYSFDKYPHWCRLKSRLDPGNCLQSAYIQGTVYSETGRSVELGSTLSLCSSIMDADLEAF